MPAPGGLRMVARSSFCAASTSIVIVLYVALNALFLYSTPIGQLAGQLDVAVVAGKSMFGELGGRIVGAILMAVGVGLFGVLTGFLAEAVYADLLVVGQRLKGGNWRLAGWVSDAGSHSLDHRPAA